MNEISNKKNILRGTFVVKVPEEYQRDILYEFMSEHGLDFPYPTKCYNIHGEDSHFCFHEDSPFVTIGDSSDFININYPIIDFDEIDFGGFPQFEEIFSMRINVPSWFRNGLLNGFSHSKDIVLSSCDKGHKLFYKSCKEIYESNNPEFTVSWTTLEQAVEQGVGVKKYKFEVFNEEGSYIINRYYENMGEFLESVDKPENMKFVKKIIKREDLYQIESIKNEELSI